MKRLSGILLVITLLFSLNTGTASAATATFRDVPASHWAYSDITKLVSLGVINGMGDGTYQPGGAVTRGQFIKLLVSVLGKENTGGGISVADVSSKDWVYTYLEEGFARGIISLDELQNNKFNAQAPIDRQTVVLWLVRGLGIENQTAACTFSDVKSAGAETLRAIATAQAEGLITGYENGTFRPNNTLTRAEAAAIIKRTSDFYSNLNTQRQVSNTVTYQSQVKQIKGDDDTNVLTSNGENTGNYVFSKIDDSMKNLKVGDVFVMNPTDAFPHGLALKVAAINVAGEQATIRAGDLDAKEVYKEIDLSKVTYASAQDIDQSNLTDGVTLLASKTTGLLGSIGASSDQFGTNAKNELKFQVDTELSNHTKISGIISTSVKVGADIKFQAGQFSKLDFKVENASNAKLKLSGEINAVGSDAKDDFLLGVIPVPIAPGVYVDVKLYLATDASGKVSVSVESSENVTAGIKYENATVSAYKEKAVSVSVDGKASLEIKTGIKTEAALELIGGIAKAAVTAEVGPKIEMTYEPLNLEAEGKLTKEYALSGSHPGVSLINGNILKYHACTYCIAGDAGLDFELGAEITVGKGNLKKNLAKVTDSSTSSLFDFHISSNDGFGYGACDNFKTMSLGDNSALKSYGGHTYALIDEGMTWQNAQQYCQSLGGHLVSITSKGEQDFITSILDMGTKNSYWLGAIRSDNGEFNSWITGEPFDYTNWLSGQPDNYTGAENALMLYKNENPLASAYRLGAWNDLNSDGTCKDESFFGTDNMGLICEWDGPHS